MLGLHLGLPPAPLRRASDATAPVIAAFDLAPGLRDVTLEIVEDSGRATVVWATSDPDVSPRYAVDLGWDAPCHETGSAAVASGTGSFSAELTAATPDGWRRLTVCAVDPSGNVSAPASVTVSVDNSAPVVAGYSPVDGATDVAVDADLRIVFGETMDTGASAQVTLVRVGGSVIEAWDASSDGAWSTTVSVDDTWTVTPSAAFENGAALAVRHSGFRDLSGNAAAPVADDSGWRFDTVAAAPAVSRIAVLQDSSYSSTRFETPPFTPAAGSALAVVFSTRAATSALVTFDSVTSGAPGRAYGSGIGLGTQARLGRNAGNDNVHVWIVENASATEQTVQLDTSGFGAPLASVLEIHEIRNAAPSQAGSAAAGNGGFAASASPSVTTTANGSIVLYVLSKRYAADQAITWGGVDAVLGMTTSGDTHDYWDMKTTSAYAAVPAAGPAGASITLPAADWHVWAAVEILS